MREPQAAVSARRQDGVVLVGAGWDAGELEQQARLAVRQQASLAVLPQAGLARIGPP